MAKVQGKKAATSAKKKAAAKTAARPKSSKKPAPKKPAAKPKPALKKKAAKPAPAKKKPAAKKKAAPAKKKPAPSKKAAPKKVASKKAPAKKAAAKKPAPKPSPKKAAKPAPKATAKPAPKKAEKPAESKVKSAVKAVAKVAAGAVAAVARAVPAADDKKRRRSRPRVTSSGPATAAWFSQGDRPRSSSFIPAPPRAEAPSLVAAPPASSDRLVGSHELTEFVVRTVPVRIDIESNGGRIYLTINPNDTTLKVGEGIEWDFRYLGGADVTVDEIVIEFDKPSPFPQQVFRCKKPGIGRPQRQLSGGASQASSGRRVQYTLRAMTAFKTELGAAKPFVAIS